MGGPQGVGRLRKFAWEDGEEGFLAELHMGGREGGREGERGWKVSHIGKTWVCLILTYQPVQPGLWPVAQWAWHLQSCAGSWPSMHGRLEDDGETHLDTPPGGQCLRRENSKHMKWAKDNVRGRTLQLCACMTSSQENIP